MSLRLLHCHCCNSARQPTSGAQDTHTPEVLRCMPKGAHKSWAEATQPTVRPRTVVRPGPSHPRTWLMRQLLPAERGVPHRSSFR